MEFTDKDGITQEALYTTYEFKLIRAAVCANYEGKNCSDMAELGLCGITLRGGGRTQVKKLCEIPEEELRESK